MAGEAWARRWLRPAEVEIWKGMSGPDRRHGLAVARRAAEALGNADGAGVPTNALAAALLHDAGKSQSRLGILGRSAATLLAAGAGRRRLASWRVAGGWRAEAGQYAAHDELGGDLLAAAGSDPVTVAWAREHHRPPSEWSLDPALAAVLKAADDD